MTQEIVDWWNNWPEGLSLRERFGMHMLEADGEHTLFEIRATDFNKFRGYFAGGLLLVAVEHAPSVLVQYEEKIAHPESPSLTWLMTQLNTSFLSNTRNDVILCESTWAERGETQCAVNTEIRDGDQVILRATSTHAKR